MEGEMAPYGTLNVTHQDSTDSKKLTETKFQNRILLSNTNQC